MKNRKSNALRCSPDYYDFYSIPFPVKAVGRIQKNKYICAQLEKLHPCFSDDCCFDSKLRISNRGLQADVVVMQKFRLAEYKSQNHHKPIYIEELKKIPFFKDYKTKKRNVIFAAIGLIVSILIFFSVRFRNGASSINNPASAVPASSQINIEVAKPDSFLQIKNLLETIISSAGKITGFSWKLNGFTYSCELSLQNIYPEQLLEVLPQITVSSVTYEKNIPLMTAKINVSLNSANFKNDIDVPAHEIASAFRNYLIQNKITVIEETVKPCGIKLRLPGEIEMVKSFFEYLLDEQISVSEFSINPGKDSIFVSIGFSFVQIKNQNVIYESIIENADVFFAKKEPDANTEDIQKSARTKPSQKSQTENKKETSVGKIIRTDGTTVEFYKDENGRIKQR